MTSSPRFRCSRLMFRFRREWDNEDLDLTRVFWKSRQGKTSLKIVCLPRYEFTVSEPCRCSTIRFETNKPSPMPLVFCSHPCRALISFIFSFNGKKIDLISLSEIPRPSSVTTTYRAPLRKEKPTLISILLRAWLIAFDIKLRIIYYSRILSVTISFGMPSSKFIETSSIRILACI
jgi:hypothetical protein